MKGVYAAPQFIRCLLSSDDPVISVNRNTRTLTAIMIVLDVYKRQSQRADCLVSHKYNGGFAPPEIIDVYKRQPLYLYHFHNFTLPAFFLFLFTGVLALYLSRLTKMCIRDRKGTDCGGRGTSCPDQLALALESIKAQNA